MLLIYDDNPKYLDIEITQVKSKQQLTIITRA